jgi:ribosomal-protein-alanine N-acetyltransferase
LTAPVILPAGTHAASLLAALHAEAFSATDRWTEQTIELLLSLPGHFALLAEAMGEPAGFIMGRVAADEAEVLTLAVRPAARRRGVGGALMRALASESAQRQAANLFLEVSESNQAARALYAGLGAKEAGRRRRYYANGTDALVLRCPLKPSS